jgi:hypothetical protein
MTTQTFSLVATALCSFAGPWVFAQEPPVVTPGYASEGRPGFVSIETTKTLPWERLTVSGMPAGMMAKTLSRDAKRGGVALLSYLPIGWQQDESGYHNSDEEIFLLEGDLTIGDQQLTRYSYTFFPDGVAHGPMSTRQGAVFVRWFNKTPDFVPGGRNKRGAREYAAVRDWNYFNTPWDSSNFPIYRKGPQIKGVRIKLLRKDPDTGEMTWMTFTTSGGRPWPVLETHPTFEEYFTVELSDERVLEECLPEGPARVRYEEHGYFWRPAGIGHRPVVTTSTGYNLSLVRTGDLLWADYFTDCSYEQQAEFTADGIEYLPKASD